MQNLFYVPPHQPQDIHPKPRGVRTVVKRNAPTRLDLSATPPAYPYGVYVPAPNATAKPRKPSRFATALGHLLIRLGRKLAPDETGSTPLSLGQPA